jgi:hypothetical protein
MSRPDRRSYPLRKVIKEEWIYAYLECGHKIVTPQDIAGHYNAESRRCRKCAKGKEKDF